jgi:hypothetical protein
LAIGAAVTGTLRRRALRDAGGSERADDSSPGGNRAAPGIDSDEAAAAARGAGQDGKR